MKLFPVRLIFDTIVKGPLKVVVPVPIVCVNEEATIALDEVTFAAVAIVTTPRGMPPPTAPVSVMLPAPEDKVRSWP